MADNIFFAFEIIGTIAFAISGAHVGIQKKMDILGVIALGMTAAVGGGIIRDLIVGNTPPMAFRNPVYIIVAIMVSIVIFLPFVRTQIHRHESAFETFVLVADAIGLGMFTVSGINIAKESLDETGVFLLLFVGVVTGVGGGVMRDLMATVTPYIFVKHFYACASLIGAALCIFLWNIAGRLPAMIAGAAAVLVLRLLAAKFRWKLPKPRD